MALVKISMLKMMHLTHFMTTALQSVYHENYIKDIIKSLKILNRSGIMLKAKTANDIFILPVICQSQKSPTEVR